MEWTKPDIALFGEKSPPSDSWTDLSATINAVFDAYKVPAKVVGYQRGAAVTTYEVQLEPGARVYRVTNIKAELQMSLAAETLRVGVVPGKTTLGIEVPNEQSATVTMRDVLDSDAWRNNPGQVKIAIGRDQESRPIVYDLATAPHLLIAGATGAGKSVFLNSMIASLAFNNSPAELRMLMIDPKQVELICWGRLPHLLTAPITDPSSALQSLQYLMNEVSTRYASFARARARDIDTYNNALNKKREANNKTLAEGRVPDEEVPANYPRIVCFIDEFGDLVSGNKGKIAKVICRLAQMARAAGIHLVISTQRPSADIVTGAIKSNFPSRIAFAMATGVDSRVILDRKGAEDLLGCGDMLFNPRTLPNPARCQAPFIDDETIVNICAHWQAVRVSESSGLSYQALFNSYSGNGDPSSADLIVNADAAERTRKLASDEAGSGGQLITIEALLASLNGSPTSPTTPDYQFAAEPDDDAEPLDFDDLDIGR